MSLTDDLKIPEIKLGVYKHYKGHLAEVLGVALHTETLEPFVLYKHNDTFWVRPYAMFFEEIELNGKRVPRFQLQSPAS